MKLWVKNLIRDASFYSGISSFLLSLSRIYRCPVLLIFVYHKVQPAFSRGEYLGIPGQIFDRHIRFIKDNFKVISLEDGLDVIYKNNSKNIYAAINFDDGYMDNYYNAYPVLQKYKIPATIFLTTDIMGVSHTFWWDRLFNLVYSMKTDYMDIEIDSNRLNFKL